MDDRPAHLDSSGVAVDRRGLHARIAAAVLTVTFPAFLVLCVRAFSFSHPDTDALFWAVGLMPFWLGAAAVLLNQRFNPLVSAPPHQRRRGALRIEGGVLSVTREGRTYTYPREDVVEGFLEDLGDRTSLVLRTRSGDLISLDVRGLADGRALLTTAGVSAKQQVLRLRLANATTQVLGGGCLAVASSVLLSVVGVGAVSAVVISGSSTAFAWLAGDAFLFLLLVRALTPALAVIGADGVTVERVLGKKFIPFGEIEDITIAPGAVVIVVAGKKIRLPTGPRYFVGDDREHASPQVVLYNRIEEARAAGMRGASAQANVGQLDRAGRSFAEWRERLRKLTAADAHYRMLAVSREDLAVVLEDTGAPPQRRVAAALALAAVDDPAVSRRVRDAVASCADPKLRIALTAAAEDTLSEEELEAIAVEEEKRAS